MTTTLTRKGARVNIVVVSAVTSGDERPDDQDPDDESTELAPETDQQRIWRIYERYGRERLGLPGAQYFGRFPAIDEVEIERWSHDVMANLRAGRTIRQALDEANRPYVGLDLDEEEPPANLFGPSGGWLSRHRSHRKTDAQERIVTSVIARNDPTIHPPGAHVMSSYIQSPSPQSIILELLRAKGGPMTLNELQASGRFATPETRQLQNALYNAWKMKKVIGDRDAGYTLAPRADAPQSPQSTAKPVSNGGRPPGRPPPSPARPPEGGPSRPGKRAPAAPEAPAPLGSDALSILKIERARLLERVKKLDAALEILEST
jgi:hypothetical protein